MEVWICCAFEHLLYQTHGKVGLYVVHYYLEQIVEHGIVRFFQRSYHGFPVVDAIVRTSLAVPARAASSLLSSVS